jgi:hypothetical protein
MSIYKRNQKGTPGWKARRGLQSAREKTRLNKLVADGKASFWTRMRTLEGAIEYAGIP